MLAPHGGAPVRRLPAFAAILMAAGIALASRVELDGGSPWLAHPVALASGVLGLLAAGFAATPRGGRDGGVVALLIGLLLGLPAPLILVDAYPAAGTALPGLWLYLVGLGLTAWCAMDALAEAGSQRRPPRQPARPRRTAPLRLLAALSLAGAGGGLRRAADPAARPAQIGHQLATPGGGALAAISARPS